MDILTSTQRVVSLFYRIFKIKLFGRLNNSNNNYIQTRKKKEKIKPPLCV